MILADTSVPTVSAVWVVLIFLFNLGSNVATVILAVAAFRKQRTEVSFSTVHVTKHEFEEYKAAGDKDSQNQWTEINQMKNDIGKIPDRLFALLANAGVIERKK
jgi:hypothetical protein